MTTESTEHIIWIVVGGVAIIQLLYSLIIYHAPYRRSVAERKGNRALSAQRPGISVIISASDCEHLLDKHLPLILEQDYPDFEVIVIDDNSKDETRELLQRLSEKYSHLYSTFTSDSIRYISHKKLSLMLGIKAAKKEWLVFTEPDCYPTSTQWLTTLSSHFTDTIDVVLGYSNYERKRGFANLCYMYDTLQQQLRMLGLTIIGRGYMGIGRNMAYRREIFFTNKGYSRHLDLERGEDDLFINEHIPARRITAAVGETATVRCVSSNRYSWKTNKLSRIFTRSKFRGIEPHLLSIDTLTRLLLYISVAGGIALSAVHHWWLTLGITLGLWIICFGVRVHAYHRAAQTFGERRYNVSLPLFDMLHPCWELYFMLLMRFTSKDAHLRRKV